ncbi:MULTISPECIES: single-stranded DNA-binding protein [Terrisporobacter]|uniref:Single-stranded DNA-binding protein n=1 Tax=Terrisporobacter muris TaxID=2963284 RepID=A0A9X2M6K8_9FIRM|nr:MULTISPECIES: single-stranded DNA-binding protein [Terrisporobacter]MCR1821827.1 single-stranded DNA-binding protein [Terrisporobacter muris]MDU6984254.1 single-stranded DNA-binding protein [Terrisporobacter othiniensis]
MNQVVLIGRLTKDPEPGVIPGSGSSTSKFTIAVNRDYKDKEGKIPVDFIPVEVIGKVADFVNNYIGKGRLVAIQGSIRKEEYMKDDEKRSITKVSAKSVQALESIKKSEENNQTFTPSYEPPRGLDPEGFQAIDDDEIPF